MLLAIRFDAFVYVCSNPNCKEPLRATITSIKVSDWRTNGSRIHCTQWAKKKTTMDILKMSLFTEVYFTWDRIQKGLIPASIAIRCRLLRRETKGNVRVCRWRRRPNRIGTKTIAHYKRNISIWWSGVCQWLWLRDRVFMIRCHASNHCGALTSVTWICGGICMPRTLEFWHFFPRLIKH